MLNIIKKSSEQITKKETFKLTKNQNIRTMKSVDNGHIINVTHWCLFEDVNASGEVVEILSIMDDVGEVFATNSKSFKDMFFDIVDILDEGDDVEGFEIEKIGGKTKAGRDFVTCALV